MVRFSKYLCSCFVVVFALGLFASGAFASEYQLGTVTGASVNLRNGPGLQCKVVTSVKKGAKLKILGKKGIWYKVTTSNNVVGWISGTYVSTQKSTVSRGESGSSSTGTSIVTYAKEFLGVKYVWGGTSPKGFDCSGFVSYVYNEFGIKLPRVSTDQAEAGVEVSKDNLKAGDLVFFNTNHGNRINHAGIYIGDGKFIHASSGAGEVIISDLTTGFYLGSYVTGRKFF